METIYEDKFLKVKTGDFAPPPKNILVTIKATDPQLFAPQELTKLLAKISIAVIGSRR